MKLTAQLQLHCYSHQPAAWKRHSRVNSGVSLTAPVVWLLASVSRRGCAWMAAGIPLKIFQFLSWSAHWDIKQPPTGPGEDTTWSQVSRSEVGWCGVVFCNEVVSIFTLACKQNMSDHRRMCKGTLNPVLYVITELQTARLASVYIYMSLCACLVMNAPYFNCMIIIFAFCLQKRRFERSCLLFFLFFTGHLVWASAWLNSSREQKGKTSDHHHTAHNVTHVLLLSPNTGVLDLLHPRLDSPSSRDLRQLTRYSKINTCSCRVFMLCSWSLSWSASGNRQDVCRPCGSGGGLRHHQRRRAGRAGSQQSSRRNGGQKAESGRVGQRWRSAASMQWQPPEIKTSNVCFSSVFHSSEEAAGGLSGSRVQPGRETGGWSALKLCSLHRHVPNRRLFIL